MKKISFLIIFGTLFFFLFVALFSGIFLQDATASAPPQFVWMIPPVGEVYFNSPNGIALDSSGNIYVVDTGNRRIQKFSSDGAFLGKWGSEGSGNSQFNWPFGVTVDAGGNVYVADTYNHRIQKFSSDGTFIDKWGSPGSGNGELNWPFGVTVDAGGNVYVVDTYNHRIQKFSSDGTFIDKWGSPGSGDGEFSWPYGAAVDASGNVYVADTRANRMQKFSSDGTFIGKWGSLGSGDSEFDYPIGIALDAGGNVYVVDSNNHRIQKFSSDGTFLDKWGSEGSGEGEFNTPFGIVMDSNSNIYVSDSGNNRIQKFSTEIDSDGDGLNDTIESSTGTDPNNADTDNDGLVDGNIGSEDLNVNGVVDPGETDPRNPDTDGDGIFDGTEKGLTEPETEDTNLSAGYFIADADPNTTTNPTDADTDDDGIIDGNEDKNHDGRFDPNSGETNPNEPDTDADGIYDGTEIGLTEPQNPTATDQSKGVFISDADPNTTTDPINPDSDGDGLSDGEEDLNKDGAFNPDQGETDPTEANISIDVAMNLPAGWSMISLPVMPQNGTVSSLFPGAEVVYSFEEESGYVRVEEDETLQVGNGYWILLDQNQNYTLSGQPVKSYNKTIYDDGWKMIGGCISEAQPTTDNCSIGIIYRYVSEVGYQEVLDSEDLESGGGFWILLENVGDQAKLTVVIQDL